MCTIREGVVTTLTWQWNNGSVITSNNSNFTQSIAVTDRGRAITEALLTTSNFTFYEGQTFICEASDGTNRVARSSFTLNGKFKSMTYINLYTSKQLIHYL